MDATSDKHPEEVRGLKQQVAQLVQQIAEKEANCQRCRDSLEQAQIAQDKVSGREGMEFDEFEIYVFSNSWKLHCSSFQNSYGFKLR